MIMQRVFLRSTMAVIVCLVGACSSPNEGDGEESPGGGSTTDGGATTDSGADTGNSPLGEELFAANGAATPNSIFGVWTSPSSEDGAFSFDGRTRFAATSIVIAARCTRTDTGESLVAAVTANARISEDELAVLESQTDERAKGEFSCRAKTSPWTTKACVEGDLPSNCFQLEGTKLTVYGATSLEKVEMTKVSD